MKNEDVTKFLQEHLSQMLSEVPSVEAVYLFGSHARGEAHEASDIDLAFLFEEEAYKKDPFESFARASIVSARIGDSLRKSSDVTVLNGSSLEIAYEIITTGICVYERDCEKKTAYEVRVMGLWYDFKPFLEELRKRGIEAL